MNEQSDSVSAPAPLVRDPSKGISLLFGILLILTVYGLAESIRMLFAGTRASLIELIIFALFAADAIVLMITVYEGNSENPGLLRYIDVWILGLIPYFIWLGIYWLGKRVADVVQRRQSNMLAIALILFIGIIVLCLCVYLSVSSPPVANLPAQY
jgi:hypothetical protein